MKLPSFRKLILDYEKQVKKAILGTLDIVETSFSTHGVIITSITVKLQEHSPPTLFFAIDIASTDLDMFEIQLIYKDLNDKVIDISNIFVNLETEGSEKILYKDTFLPDNLEAIEKIEIRLVGPYKNKNFAGEALDL